MSSNRLFRAPILLAITALIALVAAGCGGDDSGGSSGDLAGYAPKDSPVYVEGTIRPDGELRDDIEALVSNVAGIDDPGKLIIDEINSELGSSDNDLTYEDDIEPWLGEDAAVFLGDLTGDDENSGVIVSTSDSGAAQSFIDEIAKMAGDSLKDASFEGTDYKVASDGESIGIVDDAVVFGGSEETFKAVVTASGGDSLEDAEDFSTLVGEAPEGSVGNVYVDSQAFLDQVYAELEPDSKAFFNSLGQQGDPGSALVSLVPEANQIEMQALSTAEGLEIQGSPDLLEALPADAFAALVTPDVGAQIGSLINKIDENGIPGEVPPGQLKGALERFGIDLEAISESIGDVGLYAQGTNRRNVGGAVVVETTDTQRISQTLDRVEKLLRSRNVPGYQPLPGSGFSIRDPDELGPQPLVFVVKGDRFAIGYGVQAAREAASGSGGPTLAGDALFQEASDALGGVPPTGFLDLQALLSLVESARPDLTGEDDYATAKPFLRKLTYVVFGTGTEGDLTTARFILGLTE